MKRSSKQWKIKDSQKSLQKMWRKISVFGFEGMICDKEGPTKWEDALSPSNKEPQKNVILDSSMVEHSAVNRVVVGSSPTRGV